jgi:La-related protein 7
MPIVSPYYSFLKVAGVRYGGAQLRTMAQESSVDAAAAAAAEVAPPPATPSFKFNVHAPEFVPMSAPAGSYYSPFMQMHPDWNFFSEHEPVFFMPDFTHAAKFGAAAAAASNSAQGKATTGAATDVAQKIVKQVEYQFSDINLVANEFLLKIMNKDTEGYGTSYDPSRK